MGNKKHEIIIEKRLSEFKSFLELSNNEKQVLIKAFSNGYFDNNGKKHFIRAKYTPFDIKTLTDEVISFWYHFILKKPLVTLYFK